MARDIFHQEVREALEKDGWTITHDPLTLLTKAEGGLAVDLGAEKIITAERGMVKIAVEVKSFVGVSPIRDLRDALGQYALYASAIQMKDSARLLYLAMPDEVYLRLIKKEVVKMTLQSLHVRVVLFDATTSTIAQWIE